MSAFRYRRRVEFAETDAAGIVHFSVYLRYMEEAEHAMWRAAGLSIASPDATVGFPRVAATIDYHAPLHFEDEFEVAVSIEKLSGRSIRYGCVLTRGETRIASGTMTSVCVSRGSTPMKSTEIPEAIVERLRLGGLGVRS